MILDGNDSSTDDGANNKPDEEEESEFVSKGSKTLQGKKREKNKQDEEEESEFSKGSNAPPGRIRPLE